MSDKPAASPWFIRFCDSFLQDRNIKWMLAVGMFILLGSSLFLVTTQWENYTPLWQYLVFLGYTAAIFGAGQWTYHRLGLRRTGTVLQGLTVLLLPILFLVLAWVIHGPSGPGALLGGLVGSATFAFSMLAARIIFHHFLRGSQPTFLASYLLLAVAGAALPSIDPAWAALTALGLWAVFAIGTMKVSRHVFWLTEEHQSPRIFGFFPILLLGAQFLALFLLHAVPHVSLDWLGVGCVLVAVPVLGTADAVARVFQQRTGDLVRPLPWSVLTPLGVGLILCASGVCLAGVSLVPPSRPHTLVFAAAGSAGLLTLVARRTRKTVFVWAMLVCTMVAYQFTPAFFTDVVVALRDHGARAVREERLPIAFYGVTYLPLLVAFMTAARCVAAAGSELFAVPLRRYSVGLACLLLAVSLGHAKAVFPVGLVLTFLLAAQVVLFRDRRLAIPTAMAWASCSFGLADFLGPVLGLSLPADFRLCSLIGAAAVLFVAGWRLDPVLARLGTPLPPHGGGWRADTSRSLCQTASLVLASGLAGFWVVRFLLQPLSGAWPAGILLAVLLLIHAMRWTRPVGSLLAILFCHMVLLSHGVMSGASPARLLEIATFTLLGQWLLAYVLDRVPASRLHRAFAQANQLACVCFLALVVIAVHLPAFALETFDPPVSLGEISITCRLLVAAWCLDAARRLASPLLAGLGGLGLLAAVGSALLILDGPDALSWLPAAWAATALTCLPVVELLHRRRLRLQRTLAPEPALRVALALDVPLSSLTFGVLVLAAVGSLLVIPWPLRVAGGLGLVGLLAFLMLRRQPMIRLMALLLVNWQVISLVFALLAPPLYFVFDVSAADLPRLLLPIGCLAAGSVFLWQWLLDRLAPPQTYLALAQLNLMRLGTALALLISLNLPGLEGVEILLAASAFLLVAAAEIWRAFRQGDEMRVWIAEAIVLAAVAYLASLRVFTLQHGFGMFLVIGLGFLLWLGKEAAALRPRWGVLVRPLAITSFFMPLVTVGIGVLRHCTHAHADWLGANSLALLLAAAFYFWRGVESHQKRLILLAGLILNVALILLWRELVLTDPQFFMIPIGITILALVQLFKEEVPERFHDPLRYLGALVILVSPTFHIVVGSWAHLFTLMVASVGVVLLAIGLRVRALIYTGTAFLLADLVAMVVRGSIDNARVLWIAGLALGAAVLTLGAVCERNREDLLQRMRAVAEVLQDWE
jgi:hypothetical protein